MTDQQQSPINIRQAVYADFGSEGLSIHWQKEVYGHIHKDEHGVKVEFASDMRQFIELGGKRYHLRQFHFHHPSEHWLNGVQLTLELHVVHQNIDDGSLVVIGVFIEPGNEKGSLPALMDKIDSALSHGVRDSREPTGAINPRDFLPSTWQHHYRYQGSLTTEPHTENVSWVVVKDPLIMPAEKLDKLLKVFQSPARFPQPLNRRFVLKTFDAPKPPRAR